MSQAALRQAPAAASPFQINADLDVPALAEAYARDGRVRIYGLLSEGATTCTTISTPTRTGSS
jgi:hypothetical protein